jgi:hypothetical protein
VTGFSLQACGTVTTCTPEDSPTQLTAAATYWITKNIGLEASFVKPRKLTADGTGTGYRFNTEMDGGIGALAGQVGVPFGRVRFFGTAGGDYYKATFTTSQTVDERTVTVDGVPQTIPGGTQIFQWRTAGWGLVLGGGGEVWISRSVGIFGEYKRFEVRGEDLANSEAETDADLTSFFFGVRVKIIG